MHHQKDGWNPVNNGIKHQSTAGFLASTVWIVGTERVVPSRNIWHDTMVSDPAFANWDDHTDMLNQRFSLTKIDDRLTNLIYDLLRASHWRIHTGSLQPGLTLLSQSKNGFLQDSFEILIVSALNPFCINIQTKICPLVIKHRNDGYVFHSRRLGRLGLPSPMFAGGDPRRWHTPDKGLFPRMRLRLFQRIGCMRSEKLLRSSRFICQSRPWASQPNFAGSKIGWMVLSPGVIMRLFARKSRKVGRTPATFWYVYIRLVGLSVNSTSIVLADSIFPWSSIQGMCHSCSAITGHNHISIPCFGPGHLQHPTV